MSETGKNAVPKLVDDPKAPELYAVAAISWRKEKSTFTRGLANIALIDSRGEREEKFLSSDAYLTVSPAGFSAAGDVVYTAIAPQGGTRTRVQTRLEGTEDVRRWISMSIPYPIAVAGPDAGPRLEESFGNLDRPYLSCAADCGRAVFIARRDLN